MAYDYARRKALAAAKLQAAGLRVQGDPARQFRSMTAEARQRATTALASARSDYHGGGAYRPGRSIAQVRERLTTSGRGRRQPLHTTVPQLGADVTTSASERAIRQALRDAEAAGKRVVLYATMDGGSGPRTRVIDGRGEQGAVLGSATGERGRDAEGEADARLLGKVQVIAAPAGSEVFGSGSIAPGDLLAFLDDYADWLDAIAELWAAEYQ